ncbi:MAG: hypothetical protein PWQ12_1969 [Clostridiales bacterium]|nr:hypothetical protein [Clostridiales bacterium]
MNMNISFGDCLKQFLEALDMSSNQLSKVLNVDNSLVNRWLSGKRIPPYNTAYISDIAGFLSKNIKNSFQKRNVATIFQQLGVSFEESAPITNTIENLLLEAQGYSLENRKEEQQERKRKREEGVRTVQDKGIGLSSKDQIIKKEEVILQTALKALERASLKTPPEQDATIYIALNGFVGQAFSKFQNWGQTIQKVLHKGWHIVFLMRPDSNLQRTADLFFLTLPYLSTPQFELYKSQTYDDFTKGLDFLIIPENFALVRFVRKSDEAEGGAFVFKTPAAIAMLTHQFQHMIKTDSEPLIAWYSEDEHSLYMDQFYKNESAFGKRFINKSSISSLYLPMPLYAELLAELGLSSENQKRALNFYIVRKECFFGYVSDFEYWDFYNKDEMYRLIHEGHFHIYTHLGFFTVYLNKEAIIELILNIISALETHSHLHMAFVSGESGKLIGSPMFSCLLKERRSAIFENYESEEEKNVGTRLVIQDPTLVQAIEYQFNRLLEGIAPKDKEKEDILQWFEIQLNFIQNQYMKNNMGEIEKNH